MMQGLTLFLWNFSKGNLWTCSIEMLIDVRDRQVKKGNLPVRRSCSNCPLCTQPLKIRIYGMAHFDESGEYWGDKVTPLIEDGEGTLSIRSVKLFADGKHIFFTWKYFNDKTTI
jgi:hypothetical protein